MTASPSSCSAISPSTELKALMAADRALMPTCRPWCVPSNAVVNTVHTNSKYGITVIITVLHYRSRCVLIFLEIL